jgi:hypothetical protein
MIASTWYEWYLFGPSAESDISAGSGILKGNLYDPADMGNERRDLDDAIGCTSSKVRCSQRSVTKKPSRGL